MKKIIVAGWYPDPSGRSAQRYYDGGNWTVHIATEEGATSQDSDDWAQKQDIEKGASKIGMFLRGKTIGEIRGGEHAQAATARHERVVERNRVKAIQGGNYSQATVDELQEELVKQSAIANPGRAGVGKQVATVGELGAATVLGGPIGLFIVGSMKGASSKAAQKKVTAIQAALQTRLLMDMISKR